MANTIKRILVPIDFSAVSRAAVLRAGELGDALGATVELLHVLDLPKPQHMAAEFYVPLPAEYRQDVRRRAEEHLKDWLATASISPGVARQRVDGKPAAEIVKYAQEHAIDLIVMGTSGRGAVSQLLLGSVADTVIRTAPCPVMTVRAEDQKGQGGPGVE